MATTFHAKQRVIKHRSSRLRSLFLERLEERLNMSVMFMESEPNNTTPGQEIVHPGLSAGVVDSWTPGTGGVASITAGDLDWYNFRAAVPGALNIAVGHLGGDPDGDGTGDNSLQVTVRNNSNAIIAGPTLLGAGGSFSFATAAANTTDVFKVLVEGAAAANDANYQLRVWNVDANDVGGNGNSRGTAINLGNFAGTLVSNNHTITRPDRDYYKITSQVSGPVEVRASMPTGTGVPGGVNGPTNLGLRIRDVNGVILATSNAATTNVDVATFNAAAGTMYFVEVYSGSVGQVNRYDLTIDPLPAPTGQISGFKYNDLNADGFQNLDEPGLQNWVIFDDVNNDGTLNNSTVANNGVCDANALEPCTLTAADGSYSLTLSAGTHRIREVPQAGWFQSYPLPEDGGIHTINIATNSTLDHIDFGNFAAGAVTIAKDAIPNDAQDFAFSGDFGNFSLDDDANATLPSSRLFSNLLPGQYMVTESALPNWDLTNLQISGDTDNGSIIDLANRKVTIDIDPGENITVTFTNTKRGTITVFKDAIPNDPQDFSFSSGLGNFILDDDADGTRSNMQQFLNVVPGPVVVTEAAVAGWDLTNIQISGDTDNGSVIDIANRTISIDLDPGENITVTFQNTKRGSITVVKDAIPNDPQDFGYTGDLGVFALDDDADGTLPNSRNFNNLLPGSFVITEDMIGGWAVTNIVVAGDTDGGSIIDVANRRATIDVDPGENITVTFQNTKVAAVTIVKNATPDDPQDFAFSGNFGAFSLDDDADGTLPSSRLFNNLLPGQFMVTEAALVDWDLTGIQISGDTDNGSVVDLANRKVTIDVDAGENITVTFNNAKRGNITIVKDATPDDAQDFNFSGGLGNFSLDDDADGTLANMRQFVNVAPGSIMVTEGALVGWDLTGIQVNGDADNGSTIDVANRTITIDLDPGENITVTFQNTKRGSITVVKDAIPDDPQDFSYTGTLGAFALDNDADGTLPNSRLFNNLQPGSFVITEGMIAGWSLTDIVINGDSDGGSTIDLVNRTATIDVDPGENITVTFQNTKRGSITVIKNAVPDDAQDFGYTGDLGVFALDDDADGTLPNSRNFGNLVPGSYMITEDFVAGWSVSNVVITGDTDNGSTVDLINRKVTLDVDPGENITVTFENTKGSAVTIVKDALPDDPQDFSFTGAFGNFSLDDDADGTLPNSINFSPVPGSYTVTETALVGWDLTSIQINGDTDNGSVVDVPNRTVTIDVDAGEIITVTFANTKRGSIKVTKDADPNGPQDFAFTTTGGGLSNFSLDDDADLTLSNMRLFSNLLPGSYTITEAALAGWDLTNIAVNDPDNGSTVNLAARTVTIDLDAGEDILITFTNEVTPAFRGMKFHDQDRQGDKDAGEPGLANWRVELFQDDGDGIFEPGPFGLQVPDPNGLADSIGGDLLVDWDLTDANGNYRLGDLMLPTGTYFIREIQQQGWGQTTPLGTAANELVHVVSHTQGQVDANLDFGNGRCNELLAAGAATLNVTATAPGILTMVFPTSFTAVRSDAAAFVSYDGAGGVVSGTGAISSYTDPVTGLARVDIKVDSPAAANPMTLPGTLFNVSVNQAGLLTHLNAVNVDTAGTLALEINGTACSDFIVVGDDNNDDGSERGGTSDAKAIFIGTHGEPISNGNVLVAAGIRYRTPIMDAMFGQPTISVVKVNGNEGDDVIRVTSEVTDQQSTLDGGSGNDNIHGGGGKATIIGGNGHDLLVGGAADDIINGNNGDDAIFGGRGADRAYGGDGNDWIAGGEDNDPLLRGGNGDDIISGGLGQDRLLGDGGVDTLYRDGADLLVSGETTNTVTPATDVVDQALLALLARLWNDRFSKDGLDNDRDGLLDALDASEVDEDGILDTLDELVTSILPPPQP